MEICVFGSAIVDFICYAERLPKPGETLHGTKFSTGYGGKGANQCVAAARLGAETSLIAKLGDDAWGNNYVEHLRKEHVNVDFVRQCAAETTGIAQISVSAAGENTIIIVVGANNLLHADDVGIAKELFTTAKILICQFETPLNATLAALQNFKGISILNAAPALQNTPNELLKAASILCVNETEAALMSGLKAINTLEESKTAISKLVEMGANIVIVTLGAAGAVYASKDKPSLYVHVPSPKVENVLDTTGAGDAFIGALAFYMARYSDSPLHQQVGAACEVAAYSVQYAGTQSSFPNAKQVNTKLNENNYKWNII